LGFWVHGIIIGVCFVVILMTSSSDTTSRYRGSNFFGFYARIRVFRALDRVSSVSGSKVMPKKFQTFQEFCTEFRRFP